MIFIIFIAYMIFIIFIAIAIASYAVQASLESKFKRYSQIPVNGNLTGAQVAERMLREHGIYNVQVTQTDGHLTDHYNPMTQTVNLSREVYYGNSVASAAVAAHECGHALQHATGYSMLRLRSNLVPAVNFSSKLLPWLLLGGILTISVFPQLLLLGIILYAVTTLFTLVTLNFRADTGTGKGCAEIRGIHIRSGCNIEPCHINILHSYLYQPPGMIEKHLFAVFSFKQRDVFITPFNHCVYNRYQGHS